MLDSLKLCNGDKAPGPDEFNMKFLEDFWHLIKEKVMGLFRDLHDSDKFVRSLNTIFLVLIAKKRGVKDTKNFKPFSLLECIYKLIAKVLSNRPSKVLGKIIGECQHTLVGGKQILNAVMAGNEVVDELYQTKKKGSYVS